MITSPGATNSLKRESATTVTKEKWEESKEGDIHLISNGVVATFEPYTLIPEVFLDFSLRERAAKRRERKTCGYLGLESHFHADARVRI